MIPVIPLHGPYIGGNKMKCNNLHNVILEFSIPQIEYTLGGTSKMGSHVYFLLIVAMVLLLRRHIVLLCHQDKIFYQTIVQFDKTITLPRKLATGSIHDYLFCSPPCGYSI